VHYWRCDDSDVGTVQHAVVLCVRWVTSSNDWKLNKKWTCFRVSSMSESTDLNWYLHLYVCYKCSFSYPWLQC